MAAAVRLCLLLTYAWFLSCLANVAAASPIRILPASSGVLDPRSGVTINDAGGSIVVFNSDTQALIPQGPATDGGGTNFNTAAALWIVFSFLVGGPLAVAGIRGWRFTIGAAIGLSTAVCAWAAFISTVSSDGIPDIALLGIVMGFFVLGSIIGFLDLGKIAGIALLGILGGLSVGARAVLLKNGLLVGTLFVNWIIIAGIGLVTGGLILWKQRIGILFGSASTGTFLVGLGVDLAINKQSGMSRGLRFLFDRNSSHLADILSNGYKPPLSTKIVLAVSLALIPILAFLQHKVFRAPFDRTPPEEQEINFDPVSFNLSTEKPSNKSKVLGSRFSTFST